MRSDVVGLKLSLREGNRDLRSKHTSSSLEGMYWWAFRPFIPLDRNFRHFFVLAQCRRMKCKLSDRYLPTLLFAQDILLWLSKRKFECWPTKSFNRNGKVNCKYKLQTQFGYKSCDLATQLFIKNMVDMIYLSHSTLLCWWLSLCGVPPGS